MLAEEQECTQIKLSAVVVCMHSTAEAFLEHLPLVHHGNADRGLRCIIWARLLQALALGHTGIHHAAVGKVQALALHKILQENAHILPSLLNTSLAAPPHGTAPPLQRSVSPTSLFFRPCSLCYCSVSCAYLGICSLRHDILCGAGLHSK